MWPITGPPPPWPAHHTQDKLEALAWTAEAGEDSFVDAGADVGDDDAEFRPTARRRTIHVRGAP